MHNRLENIFAELSKFYKNMDQPSVTYIANLCKNDPFKVLVSTVISLRTRDHTTKEVSFKLFSVADNCKKLSNLSTSQIEELINKAAFYRKKSRILKELATKINNDYNGKVPDNIDELLKIKGVGRKTATLVMIEGFKKNEVCVDTHVHRIVNRLGIVQTKTPEITEKKLKEAVPQKYWIKLNEMLVVFGQNICRPITPYCSTCTISTYCDKIGIAKSR
jgi:endonuclease-3